MANDGDDNANANQKEEVRESRSPCITELFGFRSQFFWFSIEMFLVLFAAGEAIGAVGAAFKVFDAVE